MSGALGPAILDEPAHQHAGATGRLSREKACAPPLFVRNRRSELIGCGVEDDRAAIPQEPVRLVLVVNEVDRDPSLPAAEKVKQSFTRDVAVPRHRVGRSTPGWPTKVICKGVTQFRDEPRRFGQSTHLAYNLHPTTSGPSAGRGRVVEQGDGHTVQVSRHPGRVCALGEDAEHVLLLR